MLSAKKELFTPSGGGGNQISRSVRLRSSASAYLNRTPATAGDRKTWTYSCWVKRGRLGVDQALISAYTGTATINTQCSFMADDTLDFYDNNGSYVFRLTTTQVFRDPAAWYHIVLAVDTTQATSSNRVKIYVNGTQITSFSTATYPPLNDATGDWNSNTEQRIGRHATNYLDGYLAEINNIDGQALTPSSFGETNAITGVWQPKRYAGTYGTNGFYLNFSDNSAATATTIGKDYSGNGNNWTPNNISVTAGTTYDSMTDVPTLTSATTANYAVLNPLDTASTVTNANLTTSSGAAHQSVRATFQAPSTGLYYMEATILSTTGATVLAGLGLATASVALTGSLTSAAANAWFVYFGDQIYVNRNGTGTLFGGTTAAGGVIQLAIDMVNSRAWVGLNNTWYDGSNGTTGNPSAGTNPTFTSIASQLFPILQTYSNTLNANFGQRPFSYTPPTGFVALNTQNLPDATIKKGDAHFNAIASTATVSTGTTLSSLAFSPGLMWRKCRSAAESHYLVDAVRGTGSGGYLVSNTTAVAQDYPNLDGTLTFNSNGYTITDSNWNLGEFYFNGRTYIDWIWNAGSSTVTNTNGTITSQVRANPTAGFSVVTYAGQTSGTATIGHGLGVAPSMIIVRSYNNVSAWYTYFITIGPSGWLDLASTAVAVTGNSAAFGGVSPTSTVFTYGSGLINQGNVVAYCFAPVAGYSAFGKYTGNGAVDGPFVFTGFRPRFLMVKNASAVGNWLMFDSSRDLNNQTVLFTFANTSDAEQNSSGTVSFDFLSNGFKVRNTSGNINGSGNTLIYMAFAENPFKNSLAR